MAIKEKALKRLAEKLNAAGVVWALGGDYLAAQKGADVAWHGFELYTTADSLPKADKVLTRLGMKTPHDTAEGFFCEYHFDGADIALTVPGEGAAWQFTADRVAETITVLGVPVPCLSLADAAAAAVLPRG